MMKKEMDYLQKTISEIEGKRREMESKLKMK